MSAVRSYFSAATCPTAARVYRRRRPERTALYRLVQQHLESWLARRREDDCEGVPIQRHVERELRSCHGPMRLIARLKLLPSVTRRGFPPPAPDYPWR